ncbi:threonine/serine ThrE exporter family protein [Brevibacterium epidermidis]|uniref:threonine/serine ThrE exporter family protein n=1 Tax=Brevibacterium epidermidis TaxID=1698 RepID=UPI00078330DF|nr:threonine/serine exporter family protein [Brevibacterium epidermidis]
MHEADESTVPAQELLVTIGTGLLAGGISSVDVEDALTGLAPAVGLKSINVAALPKGLFLTVGSSSATRFERIGADLRFDQTAKLLDIVDALRARRLGIEAASRMIESEVYGTPPRWPAWLTYLGALPIGIGLCLLLEPGLVNLAFAAFGSLIVAGALALNAKHPSLGPLLPVASAFIISVIVLAGYRLDWLESPLRTVVATLALLLPGSAVVTGLTEISAGALSAGSSRLVSSSVQLAMFIAGVAGAAVVTGTGAEALANSQLTDSTWWLSALGVAAATLGLIIYLHTPLEHTVPIVLTIAAAALAQLGIGAEFGAAIGGLAGALTASLVAVVLSRLPKGPIWRISFVPAFLVVAPGSFGLLNASQIEFGDGSGVAGSMLAAGATFFTIAIGTVIGSAIAHVAEPKDEIVA